MTRTKARGMNLVAALVLVIAACGDDGELAGPTAAGTITVSIASRGDSVPAAHELVIDGGEPRPMEANGTLTLPEVPAGTHTLELVLGANCEASGPNPRTVTVFPGLRLVAAFDVVCRSTMGDLTVSISSAGADLDADGYAVELSDSEGWPWPVGVNDTLTLTEVVPGPLQVELVGIAPNCRVTSGNPVLVSVPVADEARVHFDVACVPRLSGRIVYERGSEVGTPRITVMRADGSEPRDVGLGFDPVWSPAGTRIAFASAEGLRIHVVEADGSEERSITRDGGFEGRPVWSPDGSRIAFDSPWESWFFLDVYVAEVDGGDVTRLTNGDHDDSSPTWSPDGGAIAFFSRRSPEGIYVMDAEGADVRYVGPGYDPAWSPDGSRIAFVRDEGDWNEEVYIMDADGSNPVRLTQNPASDREPAWSPDGTWIAFSSNRNGNREIYIMAADGWGPFRLTYDRGTDRSPSWAP